MTGSTHASVIDPLGHTPACTTNVPGGAAVVGDTPPMPDSSSAHADFSGHDARAICHPSRRKMSLSDQMGLFMCHDYRPNAREIHRETPVEVERKHTDVGGDVSEGDSVEVREGWDATPAMTQLITPSLQCNKDAGDLLPTDEHECVFLMVPNNAFCPRPKLPARTGEKPPH